MVISVSYRGMSITSKLRRFDLIMIIVSLVIGVGIFKTPATVAKNAGSEFIFFAAWIFGGLIAICGALTFAEIGARLPVAGGYYKIFSFAYHPAYAFMLNWSQVIINAGSAAGVALIGAEYIQPVLVQNGMHIQTTAIGLIIILFLSAMNFAGIKMGARTQNFLSLLKIAMITVFCAAIFFHSGSGSAEESIPSESLDPIRAFGISLIAIFFTYGGYQQTINFGADIPDAKRNLPRAIFAGVGIVIFLYLLLNITYVHILGFDGLAASTLPASGIAGVLFGNNGAAIVSVVLFVSVLGFLNTSFMSNPRVYYAMAEEKILPPVFKKINSRTQVQEFALTFFVAVMIISLFTLGSFDRIVNYVIFIDSISLASAGASVFILRRKQENTYDGFRMKLYPVVPALFVVTLLFVTYNTIVADLTSSFYGFVIFLAGLPLYIVMKKIIA